MYEISEEDLLRDVVRRVLIAAEPDAIILCGSRARGTARLDSDLDLLMIDREADRRDLRQLYHGALSGIHLPKNIFIERRVLHERPSEFDSESVPANDYADHAHELLGLGDHDFEAAEPLLKAEGHPAHTSVVSQKCYVFLTHYTRSYNDNCRFHLRLLRS